MRVARLRRKRAVVGDEEQRAAAARQRLLEVLDRVDVEMVRRLVEDQQVRVAHQRRGQQHAPLRAGGQRLRAGVELEREVARRLVDARLDLPRGVAPRRAADLVQVRADGAGEVERHVLRQARHAQVRLRAPPSPESGASDALEHASSVDLPAPLRPRRPRRSPSSIWRLTASSSGGPARRTEPRAQQWQLDGAVVEDLADPRRIEGKPTGMRLGAERSRAMVRSMIEGAFGRP